MASPLIHQTIKGDARGIRNNNPLNIRCSSQPWKGKILGGSDKEFEQFTDIWMGIRAAMINIRTHVDKDKRLRIKTTVQREIERWAPRSENDTNQYIRTVCEKTHLVPSDIIDFNKKNIVCRLCWGMAFVECGVDIPFNYFETSFAYI